MKRLYKYHFEIREGDRYEVYRKDTGEKIAEFTNRFDANQYIVDYIKIRNRARQEYLQMVKGL